MSTHGALDAPAPVARPSWLGVPIEQWIAATLVVVLPQAVFPQMDVPFLLSVLVIFLLAKGGGLLGSRLRALSGRLPWRRSATVQAAAPARAAKPKPCAGQAAQVKPEDEEPEPEDEEEPEPDEEEPEPEDEEEPESDEEEPEDEDPEPEDDQEARLVADAPAEGAAEAPQPAAEADVASTQPKTRTRLGFTGRARARHLLRLLPTKRDLAVADEETAYAIEFILALGLVGIILTPRGARADSEIFKKFAEFELLYWNPATGEFDILLFAKSDGEKFLLRGRVQPDAPCGSMILIEDIGSDEAIIRTVIDTLVKKMTIAVEGDVVVEADGDTWSVAMTLHRTANEKAQVEAFRSALRTAIRGAWVWADIQVVAAPPTPAPPTSAQAKPGGKRR